MEFVASQEIVVHYNATQYKIWSGVKRKREENSESRGKPLIVQCELTNERRFLSVANSPFITLCTWDVEPDPKINWNDENLFEPEANPETHNK